MSSQSGFYSFWLSMRGLRSSDLSGARTALPMALHLALSHWGGGWHRNHRHANKTLAPKKSQHEMITGLQTLVSRLLFQSYQHSRYAQSPGWSSRSEGKERLQILDCHAAQDLITAISDFFRYRATGTETKSKDRRDEHEHRQHRKDRQRREPRRYRLYNDNSRCQPGREPRRHGQRGRNDSVHSPISWSRTLTV